MRIRGILRTSALGLLIACTSAHAQLSDYTPPGGLATPRVPTSDRIRRQASEARWRLGRLRLDPRVWLRNSGYSDNVFATPDGEPKVADLTATVGAGLVAFLNLGPSVIASAYVLPEYVWWQDLDELRTENDAYGVEVAGQFNRMRVEATGYRLERQSPLSSESEIPTDADRDGASLALEIDMSGRLALFASAARERSRHELDPAAPVMGFGPSLLDRDEEIYALGLAYSASAELTLKAGIQANETDFAEDLRGRDNEGRSPLVGVEYSGGRFQLEASAVRREIDFASASALVSADETVYRVRSAIELGSRLALAAYGARDLRYSVLGTDSLFLEQKSGVAVEAGFGRRFRLRLFAEEGENEYAPTSLRPDGRTDDLAAAGGSLAITVRRGVALSFASTRTEVDSELPELNRAVASTTVSLDFAPTPLFRKPSS